MPLKAKEQCWPKTNTLMKHRIQTYNTFHIPIRLRLPSGFWIFLILKKKDPGCATIWVDSG